MDALLQKLQEALVKGLSPTARLAGIVGESLGKPTAERIVIPPEDLWEGLSNFVLLIASANHDLNMCRRDLFKADLDAEYKAMCSNKQPVELELFANDLAERLKTVKESKKASQQLTAQKRKREEPHSRGSHPSRQHFLFPCRGSRYQDHHRRKFQQQQYPAGNKRAKSVKQKSTP